MAATVYFSNETAQASGWSGSERLDRLGPSLDGQRLDPGETTEVAVWFTQGPEALLSQEAHFGLGAMGAMRGELHVFRPTTGWNGAELQVRPWARWIVAGVLTAVCVAALAALGLLVIGAIRGRHLSRA